MHEAKLIEIKGEIVNPHNIWRLQHHTLNDGQNDQTEDNQVIRRLQYNIKQLGLADF